PMTGGYILHRMYLTDVEWRDFGWMALYTPSGFGVNYAQDDFGVMYRDAVTLLLIPRSERHQGIGSCYVYVRDADALHAELVAKGATVQGTPVSHPWGLRDFQVLDLEGNRASRSSEAAPGPAPPRLPVIDPGRVDG
ncbi:MAG: VOC family protein, partial [Acidimicrobiales bacterium]